MLSRESRAEPLGVPGLRELSVHVDWVRLAPDELDERLAAAIRAGGPVGVMFHHEEMDAASLDRAADLLDLLAGHRSVRVRSMMELALPGERHCGWVGGQSGFSRDLGGVGGRRGGGGEG